MFVFFLSVKLPLDKEFFNQCDGYFLENILLNFTGKLKWLTLLQIFFCLFIISHDLKENWEILRLSPFRPKSIADRKMYNL